MHTSLGRLVDYLKRTDLNMHDELAGDEEIAADTRVRLIELLTDDVAHYVIDQKLVNLVWDPDKQHKIARSACAMIKAGIRHLPFDPILLEFASPSYGGTVHCYVRLQSKPMYGAWSSAIVDAAADGIKRPIDFAAYVVCTQPDTRPDRPDKNTMLIATIDARDPMPVILRDDNEENPFWVVFNPSGMRGLDEDLSFATVVAMHLAIMLLNTRGIIAEHVDTAKLNKARAKDPLKSQIRPYHVVRVGHVYDAAGKAHDVAGSGRHMPVHWRAGHIRSVRYGPAGPVGARLPKESRPRKDVWIEPCLVNFDPGDGIEPTKDREVRL